MGQGISRGQANLVEPVTIVGGRKSQGQTLGYDAEYDGLRLPTRVWVVLLWARYGQAERFVLASSNVYPLFTHSSVETSFSFL